MNLMKTEIASFLVELNRQFYQSCAESFSKTRQRIQPGVTRIINQTLSKDNHLSILDLGCGNGELARVLSSLDYPMNYTGMDFSIPLMESGTPIPETSFFRAKFLEVDLIKEDWQSQLNEKTYDRIFCFAVLHHIPGRENRKRFLSQVSHVLNPNGLFAFSTWQFLRSPRLVKRIQSWELVNLSKDQVEENDYLLDWRAECQTQPLRYVHHCTVDELEDLRLGTGFQLQERFTSDGHTGDLSEYQIWSV